MGARAAHPFRAIGMTMGTDLANRAEAPLRTACALAFRIGALVIAALLMLACLPGVARATGDDEGDAAVLNSVAGLPASGTVAAQDSTIADGEVLVDADGASASLPGSPFALEGFSRAQVGSNSEAGDGYVGYRYYTNSAPGSMAVIVADSCIVVYLPSKTAQEVGFDESSLESQAYFKALLIALDAANAKGGSVLSRESNWIFSSDPIVEYQGVVFKFDQELKAGQYYATVVGADGSDVTDPTNPAYIKLDHADFGTLVSASDVHVVAPLTGIDAFVAFLASIDLSPLWVTLKTTLTAIVFIFILGLLAAYFSLRIPARAQDIADSIFTIPMVLPPTVCGFLLLLAFGKNTPVGQWFMDIGFPLIFSWQATVLAAVVVAFPLMYRSARGAFENLDPNMLDAARTLGWSNAKIFFKLMLPLSWSSIAAGTVLSFARALGEFGATLFLAGNYLGITRTVPIAIYFEWMNGNVDVAIFWTIVIMVFSFVVILFINLWGRRTTKYRRGVDA